MTAGVGKLMSAEGVLVPSLITHTQANVNHVGTLACMLHNNGNAVAGLAVLVCHPCSRDDMSWLTAVLA